MAVEAWGDKDSGWLAVETWVNLGKSGRRALAVETWVNLGKSGRRAVAVEASGGEDDDSGNGFGVFFKIFFYWYKKWLSYYALFVCMKQSRDREKERDPKIHLPLRRESTWVGAEWG